MKTIIWKELRENLKWAVLALLCLTMAEVYVLYQLRHSYAAANGELTLCNTTFLLVSALGCSIIGAALGAIQILPELRRDHWALLLHRPVSRATIFFGKVAAGLLLYLLATAVPLLISIAYVAIPGLFAVPFIPRMALPAITDLLLGCAFYFAALLISLSRGPWYGRRAVLALALLPLFGFHLAMGWPQPPLIASLVLMLAAFRSMVSNGPIGDGPLLGRLCSVLIVLAGVEVAALVVLVGLAYLPGAVDTIAPDAVSRGFELATDGRVFISSYSAATGRKLTEIDGKTITDERYIGNNASNPFSYLIPMFEDRQHDRSRRDAERAQQWRLGSNYIEAVMRPNADEPECWFLDVAGRYFIGYDKLNHRCIGICDRNGFQPAGTRPQPFAERPFSARTIHDTPLLYSVGNRLYGIDFGERTLSTLFHSGSDTLYSAVQIAPPPAYKAFYIAVALENEIRVLDLRGALVASIAYTHDLDALPAVAIATTSTGDRFFLQYSAGSRRPSKPNETPTPTYLEEIDLHGKVVHSYSALLNNAPLSGRGWLGSVVLSAVPVGPIAIYGLYSRLLPSNNASSDSDFAQLLTEEPFNNLSLLFCISVVMGIGAFLWARRAGFAAGKALGWAAFVSCFGVPGLITFRLAAGWPTRVPCPACSHKRPIETEDCPSCHQAWPAPVSNGTEIFADSRC